MRPKVKLPECFGHPFECPRSRTGYIGACEFWLECLQCLPGERKKYEEKYAYLNVPFAPDEKGEDDADQ